VHPVVGMDKTYKDRVCIRCHRRDDQITEARNSFSAGIERVIEVARKELAEPCCDHPEAVSGEVEFHPVMPFWIDTDGYTDRDREMFVCGVEYDMVYRSVLSGHGWNQAIHNENTTRIRLMLGKLKARYRLERVDECWSILEVE